jgi:hypothetical protein
MRIPINGSWLKPRDFHFALLLTLTSGAIPRLSAAPVITGVVNAASYADPLLPGSLIATGSIFVVNGDRAGTREHLDRTGCFPIHKLEWHIREGHRQWQNCGRAHVLHLGNPGCRADALKYAHRRLRFG